MSRLYKTYLFRNKDPEIDKLRTVFEDYFGARLTRKHLKEIEKRGGPLVTTLAASFWGVTKRPQNATLEAAGRAVGYERQWVKRNSGKK